MRSPKIFALVDCNNFFVSCERVFRPDLEGRPVVVLSSNDGCAVARSNEAKAIGIPMGAPAFKYRELFNRHGVVSFSGNFDLYGNMSRRIIDILTTVTPKIEVYSVDESFLELSHLRISDYTAWGKAVRQAILEWTGIPVSIGIAPTKTLAKLASARAKKDPEASGVLDLATCPEVIRAHTLQTSSVQDIWGVGWRLAPRLRAEGIGNALQLSQLRLPRAKQLMGVQGSRLVSELRGISCYALEQSGVPPKQISRTRTFGQDTSEHHVIEAALTSFATTAAFRLRLSKQLAHRARFFATTSRFKPGYQHWSDEITYTLPTADTGTIIRDIIALFRQTYNPRAQYHRAGVILENFVPDAHVQTDLLNSSRSAEHDKATARMRSLDQINQRFGKNTLRYASADLARNWEPQHRMRSPRYTTHLDDIPLIRIA